jgi:Zn finger protein HypA/HybF involved in hydrogenase expression
VPLEYLQPHTADRPMAGPAHAGTVTPIMPRLVRCTCEECGAHTNAVWTFRVGGSCPTCGSFRLAALEGVELMDDPRLVA